jgi:uncharacterized membrane protein
MKIRNITATAMLIALGIVIPMITANVPQMGQIFLLIHIPALLAGLILGPTEGLLVGILVPLLRSLLTSMPPLFPVAFLMSLEMGTYGLCFGLLAKKTKGNQLQLFGALVFSLLLGRLVWGVSSALVYGITRFGIETFLAGAFFKAWPGILLQLILIPLIAKRMHPSWLRQT